MIVSISVRNTQPLRQKYQISSNGYLSFTILNEQKKAAQCFFLEIHYGISTCAKTGNQIYAQMGFHQTE
jgi:hypothetical protein